MSRLVKNGKIFLDGTLRENEKEKLVFDKMELIEDWEEEHGIKVEEGLKALTTILELIDGHVEVIQYSKKSQRYELKIFDKVFYINEQQYQALKGVLIQWN